ncbi:hypothetical protein SAICODRAFT_90914 [Saitoella complicata NRRL Y-17804]|uniref:PNPLA domain-containing protein n=1 Tax=Saitoella complicata (strain BCRC 22490 / CBS 7301 / JCM 7358 / NBRC 10748 / NRRL Y-17804) TaxID=698492 RepID=A0A0E9NAU4_SAICN|nr:uncharacterized protein SAICODRAFT_90914 [Saitoella complicata NRRL Y-17804]ODQ53810.1 hypothetical protein SAICODRAFT_90914 [Saitoella complicata NRRL Y-17804]GAO46992.1 hypothetical protein G7K_1206-t1 [Saitoella complicata NRRL Y-17804]
MTKEEEDRAFSAWLSLFIAGLLDWIRWIWGNTHSKTPLQVLSAQLKTSESYQEYVGRADVIDQYYEFDVWRQQQPSRKYDWQLLRGRVDAMARARQNGDLSALVEGLRSGLLRNLGNLASKELHKKAFVGTKFLIEEYIAEVCASLRYLSQVPTTDSTPNSAQRKFNFFRETRQSFGRTALILQGGTVFGLFHLGVIKALHEQNTLPRIIAGHTVGALIAALVCIHTDDELPSFLSSQAIDLSAFRDRSGSSWAQLYRKLTRLITKGVLLDVKVLERCVADNVGDTTFEEAYKRTKRILNITISGGAGAEESGLLNYLTAPNVLIRTAALASLGTDKVELLAKEEDGTVVPWDLAYSYRKRPSTPKKSISAESPYTRITELFNVNHFIVSQARPYLAPFLSSDSSDLHKHHTLLPSILRLAALEIKHRLQQLDSLGLLPARVRRFVVDEYVPSQGDPVVIVPALYASDAGKMWRNPTKEMIEYFVLKGERATWPALALIDVRLRIELTLDRIFLEIKEQDEAAFAMPREGVEDSEGSSNGTPKIAAKVIITRKLRAQSVT